MDKLSRYNIVVPHEQWILMYNTLCNSLVCYTSDEYDVVASLMKSLSLFEKKCIHLYKGLKDSGFIVDGGEDELEFVKSMNKKIVFDKSYCHLTINPTLDCNLTCWYCCTEYAHAVHSGRMSDETVSNVKKHIRYLIEHEHIRIFHLDWFGGEPLMYFDEVIEPISSFAQVLCKKNNVKYTQHATTNATLLTEKMAERMNQLGFTSFQIPLDGDEKHHNKIKYFSDKSGTYRREIDNINMLCEKIPTVGITLRINYDKKTLYRIQNILPDIKEETKKRIMVDFQKVWQITCDDKDKARLKEVKKLFEENGLHSNYWTYQPKRFHRCYADRRWHYAINYNAEVFKCTARDYGKDKVIGILKNSGKIEWNDELLSKLFSHPTFDRPECLNCKILPICMGPCITSNFEARSNGIENVCVLNSAQYPLDSFVIDEAYKRGLISKNK